MKFSCCMAILIMIVALLSPVSHAAKKKQILALNSYHKGYGWSDGELKGIEEALNPHRDKIQVHYEFMDTKKINTPESRQLFFRLLQQRYTKIIPDVIIVNDDNAFQFILEFGDRLFNKDIPTVFVGVNDFDPKMLDGHEHHITGLVQGADITETIRMAIKFKPDTTHVAVITDATTTGRAYRKQAAATTSEFPGLKYIFIDGFELSHEEMVARLKDLPATSMGLLLIWLRDKNFEIDIKKGREEDIFEVMAKHLHLKYVYEDKLEEVVPAEPEVEIRPEQLAALPADLLSRLHDAAVDLDRDQILVLTGPIKAIDTRMARALDTAVQNFALGPLLDLLEKIE